MFDNKEKKDASQPASSFDVQTIPDIFYGGSDPVIYPDKPQNGASAPSAVRPTPIAAVPAANRVVVPNKPPVAPSTVVAKPAVGNVGGRKKPWPLIIAGSLLFLFAILGISFYYLNQAKNSAVTPTLNDSNTEIVDNIPVEETENEEIIAPTSTTTESEAEITPPSLSQEFLTFPGQIFIDTADLDSDLLTDMEEEIFGTDSGVWDSDGDSYYDGQEIYNLYSPKGFSPSRLVDSALVREYINSSFGYRVYYPALWQMGEADFDKKIVLFSSVEGDFVEIRGVEKSAGEEFSAWFGRQAPDQRFSDLVEFENRFKEKGWKRTDDMVAYFPGEGMVYVIIYHPRSELSVPFRQVTRMIFQSFRPTFNVEELPTQPILPTPESPEIVSPTSTPSSTEAVTDSALNSEMEIL